MRLKILPIIIFFSFALVVAKVFDLALDKNSKNTIAIQSDMQAAASGKSKDKKEEPSSKDAPDAGGDKAAEPEKTKPETNADASKDPTNIESSPTPQKDVPKNIEISDKTPMEKSLLESFAKRRSELDDLANSISMKESVLNATEKKINSKMEELKKLETEVSSLLAQYKSKEDEKNKKLVKIYEGMKPAESAKIFDTVDINILLDIVGAMKEDSAAKIIAKMSTAKAKELTTKLSEQKRLVAK